MSSQNSALRITAVTASAQLGGTERMLLDFASRAFEHDIALKVLTPLKGPLVRIFANMGIPTSVVPAPGAMLRGSQQVGHLGSLPLALAGLWKWSRQLVAHEFLREADVAYSVAFKSHLALALARCHPVVWHLHEFPPATTGKLWWLLAGRIPDALIANSEAVGEAWWGGGSEGRREKGKGKRDSEGRSGERERGSGAGPPFRRCVVIPNGVNLDRFKPAERTHWIHDQLRIPREHRLVGMPAVFARWKGQIETIEAFSRIVDEHPDVHLVIVGGSIYDTLAEREFGRELEVEIDRAATGEWAAVTPEGSPEPGEGPFTAGQAPTHDLVPPGPDTALEGPAPCSRLPFTNKQARQYCGDGPAPRTPLPRIHHLPFQPKIEKTYPEFDLAVHYSLRPEPFGRVVVEAMACGVPVIAADEGGPREILGGRVGDRCEAGWLAEPRNPEALARVLCSALALSAADRRAIGSAGRRRAEDRYSWRRFAAEVSGVLRGTADRRHR